MAEISKDELVESFLKAHKKEVEDFGFSRRVMHRLPRRSNLWVNLWTLFCSLIAITLFFVFDGLAIVQRWFMDILGIIVHGQLPDINTTYFCVAFLVLIGLGIQRICSIE